jgi:Helicase HerA, central domain
MDAAKKSKIALAGASAIAAEPFLAMLPHSNGISVVASLIIGGVVYNLVETIEERTGRDLSLPVLNLQGKERAPGQRGLAYRLLNGKSTRDDLPTDEELEAEVKKLQSGVLNLGRNFTPYADTVLSKRIGIFGIPGSGKSNALTVFIEEIGKLNGHGVPFLYIDTEGEAEGLLKPEYLMRQYHAGAHNTTLDNARKFGTSILERGRQVVFDVQSYPSNDVAAAIICDIIAGMWTWEDARENEDRVSCFVILDEAAMWLPQRQEMSALSRDQTGKALFQKLQSTFFQSLVSRGRKRGLGFVFATQRPADLDKRAISCDWFFLFRQTFPNDLKVYAGIGVNEDEAGNLQDGQAIIVDATGNKAIRQFRFRHSQDNAKSPGMASLTRYESIPESDDGPDTEDLLDIEVESLDDDDPLASISLRRDDTSVTSDTYPQNTLKSENSDRYGDVRNAVTDTIESAPEQAVSGQNAPLLPPGWTQETVTALPYVYKGVKSLDDSLKTLEISTGQRNRDFARDILKQQGLWKDGK